MSIGLKKRAQMSDTFVYFFLISMIIIGLILLMFYFSSSKSSSSKQNFTEAYVKEKIASANYCETKVDCLLIIGKCPFGCYLLININEESKVESLLKRSPSYCDNNNCPNNWPDFDCIEGQCKPIS